MGESRSAARSMCVREGKEGGQGLGKVHGHVDMALCYLARLGGRAVICRDTCVFVWSEVS
eukprot:209387-Chlamydomonas_euryale.AAC.2